MIPSLIAHVLGALTLVVAVVVFLYNYKTIISVKPYDRIILLLLTSLVITLHGLSHLGLEKVYGYNPFNWLVR